MGSKKKHERSKSHKKHKHKKHKKKKEKVKISDVSDARESSDLETTASTQEALEQYDRILLALESEKDKMHGNTEAAETAADVDVFGAQSQLDTTDASTSIIEQILDMKESGGQPCSENERSSSKEKIPSGSKDGQLQDRSQNGSRSSSRDCQSTSKDNHPRSTYKNHQSRSRSHRSRSRGRRSRSRSHRSRSRSHQSRSRGHHSRRRNCRSRSRGRRSRSRNRRSRNRGDRSRSRGRQSRSGGHNSRRHYRSSSRSSSRGHNRSQERKRRQHRRRRRSSSSSSSSSSSRSYSPKKKNKLVVEKVEPPQGSLESFTTLCQQLAKQAEELPDVNFPIDDVAQQQPIRAPFNTGTPYTQNLVFHNNAWKTSMQVMTEKTMTSSVAEVFPCSSGTEHQTKEVQETLGIIETPVPPQEPVDIGALSQRRLQLQQQLQVNPMDIQAYSSYLQVEQQIAEWSNAQKVPGQFTGQKKATGLLGKDLHATGRQAWVKKDMFARLNPVRSDFGLKMMKKMGWVEGTPLGKAGVGHIVPPVLSFQVDRKGLVSEIDSVKVTPPPNAIKSVNRSTPSMFKGKHPVSALQELAAKKQWVVSYDDVTIPGKLGFCYKVTLPLGTFQPSEVSTTKKQAKLHAALNCLVGIGALPAEEVKSILESQA